MRGVSAFWVGFVLLVSAVSGAWAQANVEDFETGFMTGEYARWPWKTGGNSPWDCTAADKHGGLYAAQSGAIGHGQTSSFEIRYFVNAPSTISFWYKTSTETSKDSFKFSVDGTAKITESGDKEWAQASFAVSGGVHTFRWEYTRDASGGGGLDAVWVDDITLPMANGVTVLSPTAGEVWYSGDTNAIRWVSMGSPATTVRIECSGDNKATWQAVAIGVPNHEGPDNTYLWSFGESDLVPMSPNCFVRVVTEEASPKTGVSAEAMYLWTIHDDLETGSLNQWPWRNYAWAPWQIQSGDAAHGDYCLYSSGDNTRWLKLKIEVKQRGYVGFFYRTSGGSDLFSFKINGVTQFTKNSTTPWSPYTKVLDPGVYELSWETTENCCAPMGVYLDAFHFPVGAQLLVCSPDGRDPDGDGNGNALISGDISRVWWKSYGLTGDAVSLDYSTDNGASWIPIASGVPNTSGDNFYDWTVPAVASTTCLVRVTSDTAPAITAKSVDTFIIWDVEDDLETADLSRWPWRNYAWAPWAVQKGGAAHGDYCLYSSGDNTRWLKLKIEVKQAGFVGFFYRTSGGADVFSFKINGVTQFTKNSTIPWSPYTKVLDPGVYELSWETTETCCSAMGVYLDAFHFPVGAQLLVCSPDGRDPDGDGNGNALISGDTNKIWWKSYGLTGDAVSLDYSLDNGASWIPIASGVPNAPGDNLYDWTVPAAASTTCLVRVTSDTAPAITAKSVDTFIIWDVEDDLETADLSRWPWRNYAWAPWAVQKGGAAHGDYCLYSSGDNTRWVKLKLEVKQAGFVGFFYRTSGGADVFSFKINGVTQFTKNSTIPWSPYTKVLDPGVYELSWETTETCCSAMGVYLDAFHFPVGTGIIVLEPNGTDPAGTGRGQFWLVGDVADITWRSYGEVGDTATIQYSEDGDHWQTVTTSASNAGTPGAVRTYAWTIPNIYSTSCWVRVIPNGLTSGAGQSVDAITVWGQDEDFEQGFARWPWVVGTGWQTTAPGYRGANAARYTSDATSAMEVPLDLNCAGFIGFHVRKDTDADLLQFKIDGVVNGSWDGTYAWGGWTYPISAGHHVLRWEYVANSGGSSPVYLDAVGFAPLIQITAPLDTPVWDVGSAQSVSWEYTKSAGATCAIDYSTDAGASWLPIQPAAPNSGSFGFSVPPSTADEMLLRVTGSRCATDQTRVGIHIPGNMRVSDTKLKGDDTVVGCDWNLATVTAAFADVFYIESDDQSCGIRVRRPGHTIDRDMRVYVAGTMQMNANGERYLDASHVVPAGTGFIEPVGIRSATLGGSNWHWAPYPRSGQLGVAGRFGLNNVGLLVRLWGRVTAAGRGWFYVDDGCGVEDGTGVTGVFVDASGLSAPDPGSQVVVTGISSCEVYGGVLVNTLLARDQSDILVIAPAPGFTAIDPDAPSPRKQSPHK